jgi:TonB family protein
MPTLGQALPPSGAVPAPTPPTLEAGPTLASLEIGREGGSAAGAESSGAEGQGAVLRGSRLGELHHRLAEAAARCYPQAARRFRLQGEVPVHFCLDAAGTATALSLEGSTGSALLDRSALECVVQGAAPLSGFEGCFLVPVHFGG